mmetsp:Transcript_7205/g.13297  ORF Transcript_7205/g.13297 Transcript_7205/m.13297 type:complete len:226 (-) Transcript_7205:182-859(-)
MPCPGCVLYGASKSGIVALSRSIEIAYPVRSYVIAPGLVDTPLTWNQVRGSRITPEGTLEQDVDMQFYQCYASSENRTIIQDGSCPWGGNGLGCPCSDVSRDDPRLPLKFGPKLWPPIDPRSLADIALYMASSRGVKLSGHSLVIDNNISSTQRHVIKDCPANIVDICDVLDDATTINHVTFQVPNSFNNVDPVSVMLGLVLGLLLERLMRVLTRADRLRTKVEV